MTNRNSSCVRTSLVNLDEIYENGKFMWDRFFKFKVSFFAYYGISTSVGDFNIVWTLYLLGDLSVSFLSSSVLSTYIYANKYFLPVAFNLALEVLLTRFGKLTFLLTLSASCLDMGIIFEELFAHNLVT
jgi:hypothetical protein